VVSVEANVMVAGEPSYQLVLAPKDHRSLVGKVTIAVDAKYGVPLRVQVFAKGSASPSFQFGYTAIQFVAPAAANYDFTPPPGATVNVVGASDGTDGSGKSSGAQSQTSGFGSFGNSWLTVVEMPQQDLMKGFAGSSFTSSSGATSANGNGPAGVMGEDSQAIISNLFGAAKPVHGSWGSGSLLTTSLFSMLITNGEVYIGAVEPSVLYAAVGHASS
jgi:hypothetical protein